MRNTMNQPITAEDLYDEMKRMPSSERIRFFSMLTSNAFREDDFSHEQVFGVVTESRSRYLRRPSTSRSLFQPCAATCNPAS